MHAARYAALAAVVMIGWRARAETPARGRIDVRGGLGVRHDRMTMPGLQVVGSGGAPSSLSLAGAWFGDGWLGLSGKMEMERFALAGATPGGARIDLRVTGAEAVAGLAARWSRGKVAAEGRLGYGLLQLPLLDATGGVFTSAPLFTHGPSAAGRVSLALARGLGLEVGARAYPVGFGGARAGRSLRVQRYAVGGDAVLGQLPIAGSAITGLIGYELGTSRGSGAPLSLAQTRHLVTVGLRASFPPPPAPIAAAAPPLSPPPPREPPAPVVAPPPSPPPSPTFVIGLVRDNRGVPLAAEVKVPEAGVTVRADTRGRFRIPLAIGTYTLLIEAPGFVPQRKNVRVRKGEQNIYNVDLQRRR
jgi:hypothetical protein